MAASWLLAGGVVSGLNVLSLWWTVGRLRPEAPSEGVALVAGGMVGRWLLVTGLLVAALQRGIVSGLLAFAGLWLVRTALVCWLGLGRAGFDALTPDLGS